VTFETAERSDEAQTPIASTATNGAAEEETMHDGPERFETVPQARDGEPFDNRPELLDLADIDAEMAMESGGSRAKSAVGAIDQFEEEPRNPIPIPIPISTPVTAPAAPRKAIPWVVILAVLAVGEAAGLVYLLLNRTTVSVGQKAAATPTVVIDAQPGSEVLVDDRRAGVTPLTLSVGADMRSIRVVPAPVAAAGTPAALPLAGATSRLEVASDPVGARVTVDGTRRGVTPFAMPISPGQHSVVISDGNTTVTRSVNVVNGSTATVMAAMAPVSTAAGWLTITAPIDLQVIEGGVVVGTSSAAKIMLQAGRHDLELANTLVSFRTTLSVDVPAGKTVSNTVAIPNGSVSINALPWANVSIDGRAIGSTPIANLEVPLGTHEVVWRHPQLGERRQTVVVTTRAPVRLQMDLNK
jgi:PEGA domain